MFNILGLIKPKLSELIPHGFVDIHSHVLPGIDDGSKSVEESYNLIIEMRKLRFSKIIGTPHTYQGLYDNTNDTISKSFEKLKNLDLNGIELEFASEYMIDSSLIKKANEKSFLTMKNNYVLVEMSFISKPINLYEILFSIQTNGYKVILAHPERYRFLFNNFDEYLKLKKIGCFFQLNLLSLTGHYGNDISKISKKLISKGFIDFFGSDIHRLTNIKYFHEKVITGELKKINRIFENNNLFS